MSNGEGSSEMKRVPWASFFYVLNGAFNGFSMYFGILNFLPYILKLDFGDFSM